MTALILAAAGVFGVAAALSWLRRKLLVATVRGPSMEPTLRHGDRVLVRRVPAASLRTGQIVLVERPPPERTTGSWPDGELNRGPYRWAERGSSATGQWLVKRIGAVGGDPVPKALVPHHASAGAVVPQGHIVVFGDNPEHSYDSRQFGYLPCEAVLGTVIEATRPRTRDRRPAGLGPHPRSTMD